jgi:hypothetical protein
MQVLSSMIMLEIVAFGFHCAQRRFGLRVVIVADSMVWHNRTTVPLNDLLRGFSGVLGAYGSSVASLCFVGLGHPEGTKVPP